MPFSLNQVVVSQLVMMALAALAAFHLVLPPGFTAPNLVAAIMLASAAIVTVARLVHQGDGLAAAKPILQSRTILLQIATAAYALLKLAGVAPAIAPEAVVDTVMSLLGMATLFFGSISTAKLQLPIAAAN